MISDALHDFVADLDNYLTEPVYDGTYEDDVREAVLRIRRDADRLRHIFDAGLPMPDQRFRARLRLFCQDDAEALYDPRDER